MRGQQNRNEKEVTSLDKVFLSPWLKIDRGSKNQPSGGAPMKEKSYLLWRSVLNSSPSMATN